MTIVVQVGEGDLVLSVAENPQLPFSCRFQEAWHEQVVSAHDILTVAWRGLERHNKNTSEFGIYRVDKRCFDDRDTLRQSLTCHVTRRTSVHISDAELSQW